MAISVTKARKILDDGEIRGKKLTPAQRRFFGAVVSRMTKKRMTKKRKTSEKASTKTSGKD